MISPFQSWPREFREGYRAVLAVCFQVILFHTSSCCIAVPALMLLVQIHQLGARFSGRVLSSPCGRAHRERLSSSLAQSLTVAESAVQNTLEQDCMGFFWSSIASFHLRFPGLYHRCIFLTAWPHGYILTAAITLCMSASQSLRDAHKSAGLCCFVLSSLAPNPATDAGPGVKKAVFPHSAHLDILA